MVAVNRFEDCVIIDKEEELSELGATVRAIIQTKDGQLFYVVNSNSFDDLDGISSDLSVYEVEEFDEKTGEIQLGEEIDIRKKERRYLERKIVIGAWRR